MELGDLFIGNWTIGNTFKTRVNQTTTIFGQENKSENIVCKIMALSMWPPCVNEVG